MKTAEKENNYQHVEQSQKLEALGKLAGGIAHDFNNILSIIEGYAHIASKRQREGKLDAEHLVKIVETVKRGAGLTRQLLAFSRQKIQIEETSDLAALIAQNEIMMKPLLGDETRLVITAPPQKFYVSCAPDSIAQILLNLSSNARDAMQGGGAFFVTLEECPVHELPERLKSRAPEQSFVRMRVRDTGEGIPHEIINRIFEPFFTTKEQDKGTGLGLSVVYGLVTQMQGDIEVFSKPGFGTSFSLYLPLAAQVSQPADKKEQCESTADFSGKTIMLVEDEPALREVLMSMLQDLNLKVIEASNGNEALVRQENHTGKIDFLMTDVMMPGMNGVKLAELFSSLREDSKIIFMSGYPFLNTKEGFSLPDGIPCLPKPLSQKDLMRALENSLMTGTGGMA